MKSEFKFKRRASVKALGCRLNQYETLAMEGKLRDYGYRIVPFGQEAELGVINTCTVTNEADAKSRNAIRKFTTKNPESITVVVGCYSQISADQIAMMDGVDYVIGNQDKLNFLDYLSDEKPRFPVIVKDRIGREDFRLGFATETNFEQRANLKIQDGCDFMCSFCVIPFARGRARSREWSDLFEEAKMMIKKGVRELILTGVNIGTYNSESTSFLDLLNKLSSLKGLDRLRISSIEPTTIPEEIFDWMEDPDHPLMPFLHVPLQSGCNEVLKKMRRKYRIEELKEFFERARCSIQDLCIGTDIMVGFPGETINSFQRTCQVFKDIRFAYCHVFTYSERANTPAAKRSDHVPMKERRNRSFLLRQLSSLQKKAFYGEQIGRNFRVLLENPKNGFYQGYTEHYVKVVIPEKPLGLANKLVNVRLKNVMPEHVEGELI